LEALAREGHFPLKPHQTRRNLLTQGVPLPTLIGTTFWIGGVQLRGLEHATPCTLLEKSTAVGLREVLMGRAGVRAEVVEGGLLRKGAPIRFG
jgi:MOSC domain-containing protein YiiM